MNSLLLFDEYINEDELDVINLFFEFKFSKELLFEYLVKKEVYKLLKFDIADLGKIPIYSR